MVPAPLPGRPRGSLSPFGATPDDREVERRALRFSVPERSGHIAIPSRDQLERMLDSAEDVESLMDLDSALSACLALARRKKVDAARLAETACCHIRARRKAGIILMQTVAWGGARSRSHGATLKPTGLPIGVDKHLARRCRLLAKVPEAVMEEYFTNSRLADRVPTESGVLLHARPPGKPQQKRRGRGVAVKQGRSALMGHVAEIVERFLGKIDVCVGGSSVSATSMVERDVTQPFPFWGTVCVEACDHVERVVPALAAMRLQGQVEQALVALPLAGLERWREALSRGAWWCCLLGADDGSLMLAYHGERTYAFALSFFELGLVTRTAGMKR